MNGTGLASMRQTSKSMLTHPNSPPLLFTYHQYPCTGDPCTYKISVVTGNVLGAGTDANVFIILYGERDTSSQFKLDNPGKNDFERASTCAFNILSSFFSLFFIYLLFCHSVYL